MYIEYAVCAVIFMALLLVAHVVIRNGRQMSDRIRWLNTLIDTQRADIKDLQDRLMARSLDQYKAWKTAEAVPPPIPPEISEGTEHEEPLDESMVGQISRKEQIVDA